MNPICDACGEGHTTIETDIIDYEYNGVVYQIKSYFKLCDYCGSELAGKEECALVNEQIKEIKHKVDNSHKHQTKIM
ncbi:MAG: hypothetical protein KDH96_00685 [Candidatus Riesia sp.]|nr:hypothetical protein [Candidatus Riesia sp.]